MRIGNFIAIPAQFIEIKEITLPLYQEISSKWGNKGSFTSLIRVVQKVGEEKIQATLAHIHALTKQEAGEYAKVNLEELPNRLEETAAVLEEKVEGWTEQIT